MTTADELLALTATDPRGAVARGRAYLETLDLTELAERSKTLRAMSLAARGSDIEASVEYARAAVDAAGRADLEGVRLMALLTLSGSLAIGGEPDQALAVIEEGIATASDEHLLARFTYQKGALLALRGEHVEALAAMGVVEEIFRRLGDRQSLMLTLNQIGRVSTALGELGKGEEHLLEAYELATELGDKASLPGIQHNLGLLYSYLGDIPTALERLQRSDEMYMELSGSDAPQHVARCEVLLGVGRFEEAADLAMQIAERNRRSGDREHEANAVLVAAQARLLIGDAALAGALADRAASLLGDDLDSPRGTEARRVALEARFLSDGPSPELLDVATTLCSALAEAGHMVATSQARFLAGRIALALGERAEADRLLEAVAAVTAGPVELRLQARLARTLQRLARGDRAGASIAARSGLRLIDDYQQVLGATDLRMGIERQGAELGEIGLGLAIDSSRPRRVLDWLERTRGRALRFRRVIPGDDDENAALLAELRRVEARLRTDEGGVDARLARRRRALQDEITRNDRERRGSVGHDAVFSIDSLMRRLGERTLLEIGEHDGSLLGVSARGGRARLVELGESAPVRAELGRVRFGMRRAARLGRPFDQLALARLGELLLGDFQPTEDVVIVPPPWLMVAPWAALPHLGGASVTVCPSAETWWRATELPRSGTDVVVAAGPDLLIAEDEVSTIASIYPDARVFPPGATVDEVRSALDGAATAHIACHATFLAESPMFSSLRLADGDLNVYDIERLANPPETVVLSACDSGYSDARPGDQLAGLTSALLSIGSRSVVASIGLVPDSPVTSRLMAAYHRALVDGLEPAQALTRARATVRDDPESFVAAASFVCVGA